MVSKYFYIGILVLASSWQLIGLNIVDDYILYSSEYANQIGDLQTLEAEYKQIALDYDVYSNEYMKIAYYLGLSHIYFDDAHKSVPLLNQVLTNLSNENHKDSKILSLIHI